MSVHLNPFESDPFALQYALHLNPLQSQSYDYKQSNVLTSKRNPFYFLRHAHWANNLVKYNVCEELASLQTNMLLY